MVSRVKRIVFRCDAPLANFIRDFAYANGITTSELIRNVLIYFHMGYLMGEFNKSFPEMKKDFLKLRAKDKSNPRAKKNKDYDV